MGTQEFSCVFTNGYWWCCYPALHEDGWCKSYCESHTSVDGCFVCGHGSQQILSRYQDLQAADAICASLWQIDGHGNHIPASSWRASRRTGRPTLFVECQYETNHAIRATLQLSLQISRQGRILLLCRTMCT